MSRLEELLEQWRYGLTDEERDFVVTWLADDADRLRRNADSVASWDSASAKLATARSVHLGIARLLLIEAGRQEQP